MKVSENFDLKEFIHPNIFEKCGSRSKDFLHPELISTVQQLRDKYGPIRINDWFGGGRFESSGLRIPHGTVGAMLSAHKFGTAADLKFAHTDPLVVQNYIVANADEFPHITRLENAIITKTWLHIEVGERETNQQIRIFNP